MRTLIFDLGGVLVDWDPRYLLRQLIDDPDRLEWFLDHVCGADFLDAVDRGRPFPDAVAERVERFPDWRTEIEAYGLRWDETIRGEIPGTGALLEDLAAAGAPLYALSNWPADTFWVARERFPAVRLFRDIVVSGEVGLAKPDPRIYRLALERFGRAGADCVFVDDRADNVAAARDQGIEGVRFVDAAGLRAEPAIAAWLA